MPIGIQGASPTSEVEILDGGAHYDGDRGWVRFRYRVEDLPATALVQFNNFTVDTLELARSADTVRVNWSHGYMQPPDPAREWHVVRLIDRGGAPLARDSSASAGATAGLSPLRPLSRRRVDPARRRLRANDRRPTR